MNKSKKPIVGAILLIAIGALILLNNLNMLPATVPDYVFTWKALLILLGFITLFRKKWFSAFALIGVGAYFLIPEIFHVPQLDMNRLWPIALIYLGIIVIFYHFFPPESNFRRFRRKMEHHKRKFKENMESKETYKEYKAANENTDYVDNMVLLSGNFKKISSYNFQGGKLISIMGGMELDLSNCCLSKEHNELHIEVIMGGLSLTVPKEWNVIIKANSIMGGIFDESESYIDPAAQITITGTVVMGGVEIIRAS